MTALLEAWMKVHEFATTYGHESTLALLTVSIWRLGVLEIKVRRLERAVFPDHSPKQHLEAA